ncbi:unnamed protein product [Ixodes persulcatus]
MNISWAGFRGGLWTERSCHTCERLRETCHDDDDDQLRADNKDQSKSSTVLATNTLTRWSPMSSDGRPVTIVCTLCRASFGELYDFMVHDRLHSGTLPFVCHRCSEAFASVAGLMLHRHEHQGEPWYFCDRCRRYFCDFGGYAQHAKGHMDAWKRACLPFFAFRLWLKKRS